jgi:Tfp pilus tip-associated adhesin PilY1
MFGFLRSASAKLVDQPMAASHAMGTPQTLDWATNNGWYVDLDQTVRERINVDPSYLQGATVAYSSSVPSATSCSGLGSSYVYKLDLSGGSFTLMSTSATKMNVGVTTYLDKSNGVNTKSNILATKEDQSVETIEGAVLPSALGKIPRRSAWREIVD